MSAAAVTVLMAIGIAITLEARAAPARAPRGDGSSGRTLRLVALASSALLLGSTLVAVATTAALLWAATGATLVVAGGWLRAAAMRNLGPLFRTEAGAGRLVTEGIHARMRHPSELGLLMWTFGLLLAAPSGVTLGLALAQLPLLAVRVYVEEATLERTFGPRWRSYARTTSRFTPWVRLS